MRTSRVLVFLSLLVMSAAVIAALLDTAPEPAQNGTTTEQLLAGRNVNMVSGTKLPGGDPWLQRQNEPSVAVSTRNPLHLLAGANDYRTVDVPFSEGELPGLKAANAGDAWLGVFKSFDGGESWTTSLIPGFPQDLSPEGMASPLKQFSTAADPIVRAGTNGLFYYSGMAFNRDQTKGGGSLFLARFIDNNNVEGGDSIKYLDTSMIDVGTSGQFIDMPRIAVDMPRGTGTVSIDDQTIPRGNVYAAYTVFLGNTDVNIRSRIMFRRSTDCGATWGSAVKITESQHIIQGAVIAIDPNSGAVYVAYRRFLHPSQTNSMVIVKSTDFGQSFTKPAVIADIQPFDQPTTDHLTGPPFGTSFRTNSYPTMTVDDAGIVYVAWAERGWGPGGLASRLVLYTSHGGTSWTGPLRVDDHAYEGHQFMPYLTFASGKLTLAWYDQRDSASIPGYGMDYWVSDCNPIRQTIDIRAAQADPGLFPSFPPSVQVSRYLWAIFDDGSIEQVQYNPPNYPLFKGGTAPFTGDYIEVTPAPMFVKGPDGNWKFNTEPASTPVFHVVWADNRDVRPPEDGVSWDKYTPPASDQGVFGSQDCASVDIPHMGMRNQNIYTSALTRGMVAAVPANSKPLGTALKTYYGTNDPVQRAFVIYVKNPADLMKHFRLSIVKSPASGTASFLEFESLSSLDVTIAAFSLIARTVFVQSTDLYDTVTVRVTEIDAAGYEVQGGLTGEVVLNPDPTNPQILSDTDEIHNPNIRNTQIVNWAEVESPNIRNENYLNPNIRNPNIVNPNIVNPNIRNENVVNPTVVNPNIRNPNIRNPNIVNPNIVNPNIRNESLQDPDVYDVTATVVNDGNTTTSYTLKTFSKETVPDGLYLQLLAYKVYYTAAADEDGTSADSCMLKTERHHELLLNVVNPNIRNPNIVNPNIRNPNIRNESVENATFALAPGEEADVMVRIIKPNASTTLTVLTDMGTYEAFDINKFAESIGIAVTSQAVNTKEARELGVFVPPATASKLIIGTGSLPDGVVDTWYSTTLVAYGGVGTYSWSLTSGELPPGLILGGNGVISGTPTAAGLYYFIVRVDDSAGDFDTQRYSIYVDDDGIADPLTIMTTSLPGGVLDRWYGATLEATGGVWPRTWSLYSGWLPPGLELDSDGVISGTIRQEEGNYPKTYEFTVAVTDKSNTTSTRGLSIAVNINTGVYFTISGTVYDEVGSPLDGVVMRGLPNTPVTSADGYYQDSVPENWSGSVIPFKSGHSFDPESRDYIIVSSNRAEQDYNESTAGPGIPMMLGFGRQPIRTMNDVVIFPSVTVEIQDALGNRVEGASDVVTLSIHDNPGGGTLTGTLTRSAVNGVATFDDLKIDSLGAGYSLRAASGSLTEAVSVSFDVYPQTIEISFLETSYSHPEIGQMAIYFRVHNPAGLPGRIEYKPTSGTALLNTDFSATHGGQGWPAGQPRSWFWESTVTFYVDDDYEGDETFTYSITPTDYPENFTFIGPSAVTVTIVDDDPDPATQFAISTKAIPHGYKNKSYHTTLKAVGGSPPYAWSLEEGIIPNGLSLNPTTGELSGFLNESGRFDFIIRVTDALAHSTSQAFNLSSADWLARQDGAISIQEGAKAIVVDSSGFIYATGTIYGGLPSAGGTGADWLTVKYDSAGNEQWRRVWNSVANNDDYAMAIALDPFGNVIVAGDSIGSATMRDFAVIKYDPEGNTVWTGDDNGALRYDGPAHKNDYFRSMAVDKFGDIVVSGNSVGDTTGNDYATIKYHSDGSLAWSGSAFHNGAARYNSSGNATDQLSDMAVDADGNIYVTGYPLGEGTSSDYVTIKYDPNGSSIWTRRYDGPVSGPDYAAAIAIDRHGDILVTGSSTGRISPDGFHNHNDDLDFATIKYKPDGSLAWDGNPYADGAVRFNSLAGRSDRAIDVAIDLENNIYVTGRSNQGHYSGYDIATIKYDPSGNVVWTGPGFDNGAALYNARGFSDDSPVAIALDGQSNVFIIGSGTIMLSGERTDDADWLTLKYADTGQLGWEAWHNGPGSRSDAPAGIAADNDGNVFIAGAEMLTFNDRDFIVIKYGASFTPGVAEAVDLIGPGTSVINEISAPLTLYAMDSAGHSTTVTTDTLFDLASGGTAAFYSDPEGNQAIAQATIKHGTDSITFYYKNAELGNHAVTATRVSGDFLGEDSLMISVVDPLQITTEILPEAEFGSPYYASLQATGGTPPYTWSKVSGPTWMSISADGEITGTPDNYSGTFSVIIRDSSSPQLSDTKSLTVFIDQPHELVAVPNPSFEEVGEDGFADQWTRSGDAVFALDETVNRTGLRSVSADCPSGDCTGSQHRIESAQVPIGQYRYLIQAWVMYDGPDTPGENDRVHLGFSHQSGGTAQGKRLNTFSKGEWVKLFMQITTPHYYGDWIKVTLGIDHQLPGITVWFDDIEIRRYIE